jgi:Tfp pilus assembly protein PilE
MQKQKGMTFIGLVLVIVAIVCIAVVAMKVVPAYIEFASVKKVIARIGNEPNLNEMSKKDIQVAFEKAADAGYVTVISSKDLLITKGETGNIVTADYQVVVPIVANASVLLDFYASTEKTAPKAKTIE